MIYYLKFLLILLVLALHLSDGRPLEEIEKEIDNVDGEVDSLLQSEEKGGTASKGKGAKKKGTKASKKKSPKTIPTFLAKKRVPHKKKTHHGPPSTTAAPTTTTEKQTEITESHTESHAEDDDSGTTELPDVITHPEGQVLVRKADLEFLEGVYKGKNKETYKQMSDKLYKALETNRKRVGEQLKDNQLFKAYVANSHNVSVGVSDAYNAMKDRDLSTFLHDWYKMEYKPKKGEIKEVEQAAKAEEEEATATPTESLTTKAPKKKVIKKKSSKKTKKTKTTAIKRYSSEDIDEGDEMLQKGQGEDDTDQHEKAKEIHKAGKKVGLDSYSQGHLLKALHEEHQKGGVQHMDVEPGTEAHPDAHHHIERDVPISAEGR